MIIEMSKKALKSVERLLPADSVNGNQCDFGELTAERMVMLQELAVELWYDKPVKYKVVSMSEAEVALLYSYEGCKDKTKKLFAGLLEIPSIASTLEEKPGSFVAALEKAAADIKIKRDNQTEDMMYYSVAAKNEYLNVSGNILDQTPSKQLLSMMIEQLHGVYERFDHAKTDFRTLPVLPIIDPLKYLYLVGEYGRQLPDLLNLDYQIPSMAEFFNITGKIVFDLNGVWKRYIPGGGLVTVTSLDNDIDDLLTLQASDVF